MAVFHVVTLGAEDSVRLAAIHALAFERPWSLGQIETGLAGAGAFVLGLEEAGGELAGFILARVAAGEAEILTLAVLPNERRKGGATLLAESAMATARAQGAAEMFLEVAEDNAAARQLYVSLGFIEVGRRANYYQAALPIDALVMRRSLT